MCIISTKELEAYILNGYIKLKPKAEKFGVYSELKVLFSNVLPINYEGVYSYSDNNGYHYAAIERSVVNMHKITKDLIEVCYWVYSDATFWMAIDFEHKNRIKYQDPRRLSFNKKLELLEEINIIYRKKGEKEINEILKKAPYNDSLFN